MATANEIAQPQSWWSETAQATPVDGIPVYMVVGIAVAFVAVYYLALKYFRWDEKADPVHKKYSYVRFLRHKFKKRLSVVDRHALDYYHSMDDETARALANAREMVAEISNLVTAVEQYISKPGYESLVEAERLLDQPLSIRSDHSAGSLPMDEWEPRMNMYLEIIGQNIISASENARKYSVTKRNSQKTYIDLVAAGFRLAEERGHRLTYHFISPFQSFLKKHYEKSESGDETRDQ